MTFFAILAVLAIAHVTLAHGRPGRVRASALAAIY
jgi:hypothetical protein